MKRNNDESDKFENGPDFDDSQDNDPLEAGLDPSSKASNSSPGGQYSLLVTLEKLLAINSLDLNEVLTQASDLVAKALRADKVDIFLYQPELDALVAMGVSQTPVGRKQKELGLDVLYLGNGGRTVIIYQDQQRFMTGHSENDPEELVGIVSGLGIHSVLAVPLYVAGKLRGVAQVDAIATEAFLEYDLHFLEAVTGWISIVLHRTELMQGKLQEAKQEARRATAEELITIIAHDLRNYFVPLNSRLTFLRNRAIEDGRTLELNELENLDNNFRHLNRLLNNLLDVNRLELGSYVLKKELIDPVDLLGEIASVFNSPLNQVKVEIPWMLFGLKIAADPVYLQQALENLVANALNHSPQGADVVIRANYGNKADETNKNWINFQVEDYGPGINPETRDYLFERYVKLPGSTGLGFGLYICREIARAHGGTLSIISPLENNKGSRFIITLPVGK